MSVRRHFLNWGVFLVCLGIVPLAVQLGFLDSEVARTFARFWPLILIGIGLGLLLRLTPYAAVGGVLVAATAGLLLGSLLSGGISAGGVFACTGDRATGTPIVQSGSFTGAGSLNAEITCADFDVTRAAGGGWTVEVVPGGAEPTISAGDGSLTLRSREGVGPLSGDREVWRVTLPTEAAFSGGMTFNAAKSDVRLGGGDVAGVSVTYNAADALLDLTGATGSPMLSSTLNATSLDLLLPQAPLRASMTLNASSLDVCTAPGTAVRIEFEETLGSNNFSAAGLVQNGRTWQSTDYATATTRIDLDVTANVSSMNLNPPGGCQ